MVNLSTTRQVQCLSLVLLLTAAWSNVQAADFVTIIGPDGRPLVVPINSKNAKAAAQANPVQREFNQNSLNQNNQNQINFSQNESNKDNLKYDHRAETMMPSETSSTVIQQQAQSSTRMSNAVGTTKPILNPQGLTQDPSSLPSTNVASELSVDPKSIKDSAIAVPNRMQTQQILPALPSVADNLPPADQNTLPTTKVSEQPTVNNVPSNNDTSNQVSSNNAQERVTENSAFRSIDGQQYVKSEYLEDKEFNLEGKKRFYIMPDGVIGNRAGGGRLETIEREKGVNVSFLNQLLKPKPEQNLALALSDQYFRMSQIEVEQALEQSCFSGKKFKKPKKIDQDGVLELVATPPLKDIFDYELVKIETPIENIKLTSYSTSDRAQKYYWPLVVFLNEKGCVIEAAGGFKTQQLAATMRQHSAIEGLITLPQQTRYMLMTPLASAVDVDDNSLTNQGQIKLTAIR